ncbi:MAG: beta-lactamase family protein [Chitinophagaceae bacterium]|nr:beta-lactamase family protein [Chitinophagaceae bacterium]MCZ2396315.1 beta-lactamase family protein [Chitinophagales bacterium]
MKKNVVYFLTGILYTMCIQPLTAQPVPERLHNIMTAIYPEQSPGAALLVMKDGKTIFSEGFGVTDLDSKSRITPETNFRMASVSKQFTAMSLLLLAKQGKVSLDDPISKYLTGLPAFTNAIQLKHLLSHTSGIADYESLIPKGTKEQVSDADVLDMIRHSDSLYFKPGSKFRYSNTGFCLITEIIRSVTGTSYPQYISAHIFQPLRMEHSTMMSKESTITNRAYGYHDNNGTWKFADQSLTSATLGDGCVYTSITDYAKWAKAVWEHQLIPKGSPLNPLAARQTISPRISYGYGWFTSKEKDGSTAVFHSGESTGFHNIAYHNPSKGLLIVIFSNTDDDRISEAFDKVAAEMKVQLAFNEKNVSLFHLLSKIYE